MTQKEAITFREGRMLVLAGPGSGKTFVITERIRYLIQELGVPPQQILTITFTQSAAAEMKRRAVSTCPRAAGAIFGTFHSVFYQIIRSSGYFRGYSFLSPYEQKQILKTVIRAGKVSHSVGDDELERMLSEISFFKNTGKDDGAEYIDAYQKECRLAKKLDYDDILLCCLKILLEKKDLLEFWQKRFSFVQVDEFQDINTLQYRIVELITGRRGNLFVVGDDDQAIYSFRGASPSFMSTFLKDHEDAACVRLGTNYRCAVSIVRMAAKCIGFNDERIEKDIKAREDAPEGIAVIEGYSSQAAELVAVTKKVGEFLKKDGTVAVLFRSNRQIERYAQAFTAAGISFFVREKRKSMLKLEAVNDLLCFVRFVTGERKREYLLAFLNKPERYISRGIFTSEYVDMAKVADECEKEGRTGAALALKKFDMQLLLAAQLDLYGMLSFFLSAMGYEDDLKRRLANDKEILADNLAALELIKSLPGLKTGRDLLRFCEDYERSLDNEEREGGSDEVGSDEGGDGCRVFLMTYHSAKGLEFDRVLLPGINDGAVPKGKCLDKGELEEERRMFYVAMTRAKEELYISCIAPAKGQDGRDGKNMQSLFISEMLSPHH